jgi:hypothetical protein
MVWTWIGESSDSGAAASEHMFLNVLQDGEEVGRVLHSR